MYYKFLVFLLPLLLTILAIYSINIDESYSYTDIDPDTYLDDIIESETLYPVQKNSNMRNLHENFVSCSLDDDYTPDFYETTTQQMDANPYIRTKDRIRNEWNNTNYYTGQARNNAAHNRNFFHTIRQRLANDKRSIGGAMNKLQENGINKFMDNSTKMQKTRNKIVGDLDVMDDELKLNE